MEFAILIDVDEFRSELSTTLAFWMSDERHARILGISGAPSSLTSHNLDVEKGSGGGSGRAGRPAGRAANRF